MKKTTIRDVARLAGVSIATVSAVVNGTTRVSARRTQQVQRAMEALSYRPDQVARSLKLGRTSVLGMVIPDISNPFYPEVVRGAEDAARAAGYSVILCNSNEDPVAEQQQIRHLVDRRVDGLLIACSDSFTPYTQLLPEGFSAVFVDRLPAGGEGLGVSTDNVAAARDATAHLIRLGHTRIALLTGPSRVSTHADRLEGFRQAMQHARLVVREEYVNRGNLQIEAGYEAGVRLLGLREPPTAVLSSNNKMLLGLMRALADLGVKCPKRISVAGFDDYAWTEHFTPRLTTIAQPAREMGKRAVEMLLNRIKGGPAPPGIELLAAELRVRESTAAPPVRNGSRS